MLLDRTIHHRWKNMKNGGVYRIWNSRKQVSVICNLETAGKIPSSDAYKKIKLLWKQLKKSKKELNIGDRTESQEE